MFFGKFQQIIEINVPATPQLNLKIQSRDHAHMDIETSEPG